MLVSIWPMFHYQTGASVNNVSAQWAILSSVAALSQAHVACSPAFSGCCRQEGRINSCQITDIHASALQGRYEILRPKRTSLAHMVTDLSEGFVTFLGSLLSVDPRQRPTAEEALAHPWLMQAL